MLQPFDDYITFQDCHSALTSLRWEFEEAASEHHLRHQLLLADPGRVFEPLPPPPKAVWDELERLNKGNLPDAKWERWEVFPDMTACSRFYGTGDASAFEEFTELAVVAYKRIEKWENLDLPDDVAFWLPLPRHLNWFIRQSEQAGWLQVVYETAQTETVGPLERHLQVGEGLSGARFAQTTDLFKASAAAIENILPQAIILDPLKNESVKPKWTGGTLSFAGRIVKQFRRQPAKNQRLILSAFEEEGWPEKISDPLPGSRGIEPRKRLRDTVNELNNRHVTPNLIAFEASGDQSIRWFRIR